jgi:hypothetical protein
VQMSYYAHDIEKLMMENNLECDMLRQKIKSKRKELKQTVGKIKIGEAYIKTLQFEVYYIYKDMDNEVKLRDSIRVN